MKIAMIGLRGIPSRDGGVEVAVGELAPRLILLGLDITVYTRRNYQQSKLNNYKGVKLVEFPTVNTKHFEAIIHSFLSTIHAIYKRYDIIHFHAVGNALFSWIPRLFGIKTVVTIHGQDWQRDKWNFIAKGVLRIGEWCAINCPNYTISVSKKIFKLYNSKKIMYIPNGIPFSENVHNSNVLYKFNLQKYIVFLSRLVPEKGVHILIDAFKKINSEYQLVIVGGSTHSDKYTEMLYESAEENKIIFTGPLFNADKSTIFKNASLFVLPSNLEGMPIVLLEAMSYGIPCLVSDIQEIRDVVEVNEGTIAFLFKSGDVDDLAKKLNLVLENDNAKIIANNAKKHVIDNYNWDSIAVEYEKLFKRL